MSEQDSSQSGWKVVYYNTPAGRWPVREFLDSLPTTDQAAVFRNLALLQEFGLDVGAPLVRALRGRRKLWELRVRATSGAIRVIYFAHSGRQFVMLHGFVKKGRKTPVKELDIAERRRDEFLSHSSQ